MVQITEVARLVKLLEFASRNLFKKQFTDDCKKERTINYPSLPTQLRSMWSTGTHRIYPLIRFSHIDRNSHPWTKEL